MGRKTVSKSAIQNPNSPPAPDQIGIRQASKIPKLILYSQEHDDCTCYKNLFNHQFESVITDSEDKFLDQVRSTSADAAVVCFCSAREKDAEEFLRLESLAGPLPSLTCSEEINPDFVRRMTQRGFQRFLSCRMDVQKIRDIIFETIKRGGLKEFLETCCPGSLSASPHVRKMIDEIIQTFPNRINESEMARKLGISQSWLQKICRQAFGKSFPRVMRRIWIHQALRMMQHTNLDNTEIALQLNYSEESSMARDFRKELSYNPTQARQLLADHTPEELLLK